MRIRFVVVIAAALLAAAIGLHAQAPAPAPAPAKPQGQTTPAKPQGSQPQTPRRPAGNVTFAILVTDASGGPISDVKITLSGPASRDVRTERGRAVFEGLPSGAYHMKFEKDGFITAERDVTGRGAAPIDVKVALDEEPKPVPPVEPVKPPPPPVVSDVQPVAIDMPSFIEKNFVGRAAGKTSPLACATGGEATLIQLHEPVAEHTHADADEFLYVIAGEGTARTGSSTQPLRAGVFMLVPRGVPHTLTASGRSPLVVISIKSGERCAANVG
jgi:mannose-6-phosphate isomerase-like protein (cupin superfamily)